MREAWLIFGKDTRHLWPGILVVLLSTALDGALEAALGARFPLQLAVDVLWLAACAYLAAAVILEDRLPGHEQYWLTRPYSRSRLLLAKLLFLTVFTGLPSIAADVLALAVNGVSPLRYTGSLLFHGLALLIAIELAVAALAAVTESITQFLWIVVALVGLEVLIVMFADPGKYLWGDEEWVRLTAEAIVAVAVASAVLVVQYWRRETAWSRSMFGGAVLLISAGPFLGSWHAAFALESRLGAQIDPSAVRISFQPERPAARGFTVGTYAATVRDAGIALPVLLTDIPAGTQAISERIVATIDAPGGSWRSTWSATGGIAGTNALEDSRRIRGDGPYWEYVNVDASFYRQVKDAPVHLHTVVAFTLLGDRQSAPVAPNGRTGHLPGDGVCAVGPGPFGNVLASCAWPYRTPARAYLQVRSLRTGQSQESILSTFAFGPVWREADAAFSPPPEPLEMQVETWETAAHFERELDIPQIRLSDYAIRRITDSQ